jgi:DNA polymerase elongation subunit (family B)
MIDIEQFSKRNYGDFVRISYFNPDGDISIKQFNLPESEQYIWREIEDEDEEIYSDKNFRSYRGNQVRKIRRKFLSKDRKIELLHKLPKNIKDEIFSFNQPKKFFVDIENEIVDGNGDPEEHVSGKITSFCYCDEHGNVSVLGLIELKPSEIVSIENKINNHFSTLKDKFLIKRYKLTYHYCSSEKAMIELFIEKTKGMPIILGWNFWKYDMRYIINRSKKLRINYENLSPSKTFYIKTLRDKFSKSVKIPVELPNHRAIVDYMTVFEKFDTSLKIKNSLSLDSVSEEVLGVKKINYSGNLNDLYERDKVEYYFYEAVDTILVHLIDEKLGTLNTLLSLASTGQVPLNDAFFASSIARRFFNNYYYDRKQVFVHVDEEENEESYEGAYVMEPEKGLFSDVLIWDYESEFPSLMMAFNMGMDTHIGYMNNDQKTFTDFEGLIVDFNPEIHSKSVNKTVYTKNRDSSLREVTSGLFENRVNCKNTAIEIKNEITSLENLLKSLS